MVGVVAPLVQIVELEAEAQALTCIYRKECFEVVFTIGMVTAGVVRQIGNGGEGVGEMEVLNGCHEISVWVSEQEVGITEFSVNEDTVQAWGAETSQCVVFSTQSCCEDTVHIHVTDSIRFRKSTVAKTLVNRPYLQAFRNLLVLTLNTVRPSEILVVCGGRQRVVFVKLSKILCSSNTHDGGHEH